MDCGTRIGIASAIFAALLLAACGSKEKPQSTGSAAAAHSVLYMCEGTYSGHGLQAKDHQAVFSEERGAGGDLHSLDLQSFDDINGDLRPLSAGEDFVIIDKQQINPARWDFSRQYGDVTLQLVYTPADGHIEYHHSKDNIAYVATCRLAKLKSPEAAQPAATPNGTYRCESLGDFSFSGSTATVPASYGPRTIAFRMNGDSVLLNTAGDEWPAMLTYKGGKLYIPEIGDSLGTMQLKECIKQ